MAISQLGPLILLGIDLDLVSPYCSPRWLHNLRCRGLPSEEKDRQSSVSCVRQALRKRGKPPEASGMSSGNEPVEHES